ncbi:MAG TPA: hypothetical protein VN778_04185 [Verrucomicrobiae bacterium]|nr:hypothetical protein [Verrucomicrobiae bacterium]
MSRNKSKIAGPVIAIIGVIVVLVALCVTAATGALSAPASVTATSCATKPVPASADIAPNGVKYDAYDQTVEGEFGDGTTSTKQSEVITWAGDKLIHDPQFAAIVVTASQLPKDTANVPKALESKFNDIDATASKYAADDTAWAGALETLYGDAVSCKLVTYDVRGFYTLEMHVNKANPAKPAPKLTFNSVSDESLGESLDITMKSGLVVHLRLVCGGQPSQPYQPATPIRGPTTAPTHPHPTTPVPTPTSSTPTTVPTTAPTTHPTTVPSTTHTTTSLTCDQFEHGVGYIGTPPNDCHKNGNSQPTSQPPSGHGTNPPPADPSSSGCAAPDPTTGRCP